MIDEFGFDVEAVKLFKEVDRKRISVYAESHPTATYAEGSVWDAVTCDVALPCATQNEIHAAQAQRLVDTGCYAVCEGAQRRRRSHLRTGDGPELHSLQLDF